MAADHYNRYREDVALMKELGLGAYQFSVPWSRVVPDGNGPVNQKGLDFYDSLVDALLEAGIKPVPVLYVWELPGSAQDRGGWANRDCADWFAEFSAAAFERLGDRATHWFTICEPQSVAHFGYVLGELAPCIRDLYAGMSAAHHLLLGQGKAVQAFRASGATGEIGNYHALTDILPASDSEEDVAAAERTNAYVNTLYLDAIVRGEYPSDMVERFREVWPQVRDDDLATISTPLDFLGFSYYSHSIVADAETTTAEGERRVDDIGAAGPLDAGVERLFGVRALPRLVRSPGSDGRSSPRACAASSAGCGTDTTTRRSSSGRWARPSTTRSRRTGPSTTRPDWPTTGTTSSRRNQAIEDGVDLRGLFLWALMDTYEFNLGFTTKFGLIRVDYETQERTIKDSGYWYRDVMASNAVETAEVAS